MILTDLDYLELNPRFVIDADATLVDLPAHQPPFVALGFRVLGDVPGVTYTVAFRLDPDAAMALGHLLAMLGQ